MIFSFPGTGTLRKFLNLELLFAAFMLAACGATVESYGEGCKVLGWMKTGSSGIERLQASAVILQENPKGIFRGDAYVFYEAPSSIRIDVLGPVNNVVGVLSSREDRGMLLDYTTGVAFESEDPSCLFSQLIGTRMTLPELSAVFLGSPPVIRFDESRLKWYSKGYYILDLEDRDSGIVEKLQLAQGRYGTVVLRAVVVEDKKKKLDVRFRKRGWNSDVSPLMPRIVEIGFVQEKIRLLLRYKNAELSPDFPEDVFDVEAPAGFVRETVICR